MANLVLYHYEECSFCILVRDFMRKEGIRIPLKDILQNPKAREELIRIGGKPQVPCLAIDNKALYESSDIIEWLKKNYKAA